MDKTPTNRGFAMTKFRHELYGPGTAEHYPHMVGEFSVQESSLAFERKLWVGFTSDMPEYAGPGGPVTRAQLDEDEALIVAIAILEWLSETDPKAGAALEALRPE
jgi:hypothetical protein